MFKLCHKVQEHTDIPDNNIQSLVPLYIIENDEDNELLKAQQFNQWKQTGFERVKKAALKVILRNDYKDYEDAETNKTPDFNNRIEGFIVSAIGYYKDHCSLVQSYQFV